MPGSFEVFKRIDDAVWTWPSDAAGPFDPRRFEDGFRDAMRAIAAFERTLEFNTRRLSRWIAQWWAEEGGRAVTFGSDAHDHSGVAGNLPEASAMAAYFGFDPGRWPEDSWIR